MEGCHRKEYEVMEENVQKQVILTISILISRDPETVRKCLDSVKPILNAVNSELILTDTGCGEEVRGIIEEYTNHIIDFKWCDDFAKARNIGLEQAKGNWFLFLDDDEWFEDTSEIIKFFDSGEYENYGLAVYWVRNYTNWAGIEYKETAAGRMIKLEKDIRFRYAIHECFNRIPGKTKVLNTFAHHYGYVYKTEEEKKEHSRRNIRVLLKEHGKEPGNLKHIIQLIQEYNAIEDYKKSIEITEKGMSYTSSEITSHELYQSSFYANIVNCYFWQQNFEKVIEIGNKYLAFKNVDSLAKAAICYRIVIAYYKKQEYKSVLKFAELYWNIYKNLLGTQDNINALNIVCWSIQQDSCEKLIYVAVQASFFVQEYEKAIQWLSRLENKQPAFYIKKWKEYIEQKEYISAIECLKIMKNEMSDWNSIVQLCLKETEEKMEKQKEEQKEFYKLGILLKQKVQECINMGQLVTAKQILTRLKEILPEDEEVAIMLRRM